MLIVLEFIGLFYFTLGNVRPQFRSKMKMINLVAACKQNYIKKYGMDSILNPFIEDLKKLVSIILRFMHDGLISYN